MKLFGFCILVFALAGACNSITQTSDGRMEVAATVSPITNLVENVGGDLIHLTGIVPEGLNSHTFEPAPTDARLLARARLIFMNGLGLEEPTRKLANANLARGAKIISLAEATLTEEDWIYDESFPQSKGSPNPHVWTSPVLAKKFVEVIREELSKADPRNAPDYRKNAEALMTQLDQLDDAIRVATSTVPDENRKLLTYHDSFPYFAKQYGWKVIGAIQPSDFSEPSPRDIASLIDQIKAERVPAIFGSEVFPSPILEQIARETGARYVAELRDDDLPDKAGSAQHSYVGLMRFDFKTIVDALGGDSSSLLAVDPTNLTETDADYRS